MAGERPNVLLIGLRGSGKSTVGRALAGDLRAPFADLDDDVLTLVGASTVREAWERSGEASFREAEARALAARLGSRGAVVALGGGTPTAPGADALIERARREGAARVAYLRAEPATLRARLSADDPDRPSLTGADPLAEIERVFGARDEPYRRLADAIIDASRAPDEVRAALRGVAAGWWGDGGGGHAAME